MSWFLAKLEKGENFPEGLCWHESLDATIPLSTDLIKQPFPSPKKCLIQLYWRKLNSNTNHPLVWINNGDEQEYGIDIQRWIKELQHELYRFEHKPPLTSLLPFNYHYLPEKLRYYVVAATLRLRQLYLPGMDTFPITQFSCGPEILLAFCKIKCEMNSKIPVLILTHDIETRYGFDWIEEISEIEESFGFQSLWNVVPKRYPINERIFINLINKGHEIGLHGIWHNNKEPFLGENQMRREFNSLKSFIREFNIKGYRSPAWYRTKTMYKILSEFFSYDLSCLDIDLLCPSGKGGVGFMHPFLIEPGLVELPCTLPFEAPAYWGITPEKLVDYWKPKIEFIKSFKRMLLINTHPDPAYLGNKRMLTCYRQLLEMLYDNEWHFMLPSEIAKKISSRDYN